MPSPDRYIEKEKLKNEDEKKKDLPEFETDEFLTRSQPTNSFSSSISDTLMGLNYTGIESIVPLEFDNLGYIFFTRPQLNLSTFNLAHERKMYSLLTKDPMSIHRYVRLMLDPRLEVIGDKPNGVKLTSPLVDKQQAFIPVFSNLIKSATGWPDEVTPTYSSSPGNRKEVMSFVDGTNEIYIEWDLDCTFKNMKEEPVTLMIDKWINYESLVFEGRLNPYLDFIVNNEIDYNTRIWKIVLDTTQRYVKKIAATGASFPINNSVGKYFNHSSNEPYNKDISDILVKFKCLGATYNDDILIREFNETVGYFHSGMQKLNDNGDDSEVMLVPADYRWLFKNRIYPRINPTTFEFEWWCNKSFGQSLLDKIKSENF